MCCDGAHQRVEIRVARDTLDELCSMQSVGVDGSCGGEKLQPGPDGASQISYTNNRLVGRSAKCPQENVGPYGSLVSRDCAGKVHTGGFRARARGRAIDKHLKYCGIAKNNSCCAYIRQSKRAMSARLNDVCMSSMKYCRWSWRQTQTGCFFWSSGISGPNTCCPSNAKCITCVAVQPR